MLLPAATFTRSSTEITRQIGRRPHVVDLGLQSTALYFLLVDATGMDGAAARRRSAYADTQGARRADLPRARAGNPIIAEMPIWVLRRHEKLEEDFRLLGSDEEY